MGRDRDNMRRAGLTLLPLLVIATAGAQTPAPAQRALPAPPANGEMGFVMTFFAPSIYQGKDDCPDGPVGTLREHYLATLSPTERLRLMQKANEMELTKRWQDYARGPDNTNICSQPELFDRPATRTLKSNVAYGLNLDGETRDGAKAARVKGCGHQKFTSPDGEPGIDNQTWRVMGCLANWRGVDGKAGDIVRGMNGYLISGEHSQVILLRGVDSLVKDDDVEVIYANTEDRAIVDGSQNFIPGASYTVTKMPQYRNVLHGRIVNGVLTTDPQDIRLKQTWGQGGGRDIRGARSEWNLRHSQIRLAFQPDGSLKGLVGGYQPLWNIIQSPSIGGEGAATTAGYDCAGLYKALKQMADGDRDESGQCTTISSSMDAAAIPAFINDRPPAKVAGK
ncbi:MAG TPA: hypothetical protein VF503_15800 [Sphingobium sp.]|uniref:hypothetical protein n=1 Tax=Sphingobium sp. TaxID=1912891 RepID=UPI002ECFAF7D